MSELINIIYQGQLFIIPLLVLIITQIIKVLLEVSRRKKITFSYLGHYGGMPSSHTALFVSLSTITFLKYGYSSPFFAIAIIICIIMIRDALGMRRHLGNHGLILKSLIKDLTERKHTIIPHEKIVTRLGHTPLQVIVGALLGFTLTTIFYLFLN